MIHKSKSMLKTLFYGRRFKKRHLPEFTGMRKGFTLVELLITVGIIVILGSIGTMRLAKYNSYKTLDLQVQEIVSVLRDTQNRSVTQENGKPWGVHFENPSTGSGFYSLFASSTYNNSSIVSTTTLNSAVEFLDPTIGNSTDVAFSAITGRPNTSITLIIALKSNPSILRTITINQLGLVAWSKIPVTISSAPQSLITTPGNTQIVLDWSAPSSNGGSSITNYKVYRGTTSGNLTLLTTLGNVLTYTNTGLTNGTTYYYKVSAVNAIGEGPLSSEASGIPSIAPTAPSAPQNLAATPGNTQIVLNWSTPSSNGGSPITNYKVYRGTTSGNLTLLTTLGNVLTYTNTGLTNGTTYYYKVSAVNAIDEGLLSNEVSASPAATVPTAPICLRMISVGNQQVTLGWSPPSSNGGSAITNYKVYRGITSGNLTLFTTLGNVLDYTNTGLTNGTIYYYKVSAVNVTGEGSLSEEAYATPAILGGLWTRKADFGGIGRVGAVGFAIGTKGYIGTGWDGTNYFKDFWEYSTSTNVWTQKADFGGTARRGAVGFAIGTKGYIGTGGDGTNYLKDFWEYNQANNTWTQKADFGGVPRYQAVGFSIGTKGYIGTGYYPSSLKDFWEYDQANNTWTQKTDFGGIGRVNAVGFAIGTKGYIGTGSHSKDFWEYNPNTNAWTQKADFGGVIRSGAVGFSIGTKGYIGSGVGSIGSCSFSTKDFWEYNSDTNVWTQKADIGGTVSSGGVGFGINEKGYIGTGNYGAGPIKDFWEFTP